MANRYTGKLRRPLVVFSVVCIIGIGLGICCGNFVFLAKALGELTGLPPSNILVIIYATIFVMLLVIREPERIKPVAFFFTAVILGIAVVLMLANYLTFAFMAERRREMTFNYFELDGAGALVGISLYSFESINTLANVRRSTQQPARMSKFVQATFLVASVFYILFGASYHCAYGKSMLKKVAFNYYVGSPVLFGLKYFVMLNPLFSIPFHLISTVELFEKLRPLRFLTRDRALNLSAARILLTRQAALALVFCLSTLSQDMSIILNTVGSLFGPALGLILPVGLAHQVVIYRNFADHHGVPYGKARRLHDQVYLVIGSLFMLLGLKTVANHFY